MVSLSAENTFRVSSHPALMQGAAGCDQLPSTPVLFELWDVSAERWIAKKIGESILVEQAYDLVLLRHETNYASVGIGYAIAELQLNRSIADKTRKLEIVSCWRRCVAHHSSIKHHS